MICRFPGCKNTATQEHHITYDPEVTRWLCEKHHSEITAINGVESRKYHKTLSNKHRWFIWFRFIEGSIKPRRTHLTRAWESGLMCLTCGSRSIRKKRGIFAGDYECKQCGSHDIGTKNELKVSQ